MSLVKFVLHTKFVRVIYKDDLVTSWIFSCNLAYRTTVRENLNSGNFQGDSDFMNPLSEVININCYDNPV